jgi:hypothetical protein
VEELGFGFILVFHVASFSGQELASLHKQVQGLLVRSAFFMLQYTTLLRQTQFIGQT